MAMLFLHWELPEVCFHGNAKERGMEKGVAEFKRTSHHEAKEVGCLL